MGPDAFEAGGEALAGEAEVLGEYPQDGGFGLARGLPREGLGGGAADPGDEEGTRSG